MEKNKSYQQMGDLQNEELRRAGDADDGRWTLGRWTDLRASRLIYESGLVLLGRVPGVLEMRTPYVDRKNWIDASYTGPTIFLIINAKVLKKSTKTRQ